MSDLLGDSPYALDFAQHWAEALNRHDVDSMLDFYADKAALVPWDGQEWLRGDDQIRAYFEQLFEYPNLTCDLVGTEVNQNLGEGIRAISGGFDVSYGTELSDMIRLKMRYTFVVEGGMSNWQIHTHHWSYAYP